MIYLMIHFSVGEGGVEADPIEAAKMFTELAERGHPFAQVQRKEIAFAIYDFKSFCFHLNVKSS